MIEYAIIVASVVYFIHASTWEKMVFSFVRHSTKSVPSFIKKPLYDCPACMSMWWGNPIVAIGIVHFNWAITNYWEVVYINVIAGGMLALFGSLGDAINQKCDCGRKDRIQKFLNQSDGTESA